MSNNVDRTSTGFRLFKKIIQCRVKAKHLIDVKHAAEFGLPSTGDEEYDRELGETWNDVYLPTSDIAELIEDGADVLIVNHADAVYMYELIQDHLEWWDTKFRESFFINPDRLARVKRDLGVLAKVAEGLYSMVSTYVSKSEKYLTAREDSVLPFRPEEEFYTLADTDIGRYDPATLKEHRTLDDIVNPASLDRVRIWER